MEVRLIRTNDAWRYLYPKAFKMLQFKVFTWTTEFYASQKAVSSHLGNLTHTHTHKRIRHELNNFIHLPRNWPRNFLQRTSRTNTTWKYVFPHASFPAGKYYFTSIETTDLAIRLRNPSSWDKIIYINAHDVVGFPVSSLYLWCMSEWFVRVCCSHCHRCTSFAGDPVELEYV